MLYINGSTPSQFPYKAMLEDIKFLMKRCNCSVIHILRENNKCADGLASRRVNHVENLVVLNDPPNEISCERA
ncbi:hypothetical protein ACSBR1_036331 [Camellia fascicularis]